MLWNQHFFPPTQHTYIILKAAALCPMWNGLEKKILNLICGLILTHFTTNPQYKAATHIHIQWLHFLSNTCTVTSYSLTLHVSEFCKPLFEWFTVKEIWTSDIVLTHQKKHLLPHCLGFLILCNPDMKFHSITRSDEPPQILQTFPMLLNAVAQLK